MFHYLLQFLQSQLVMHLLRLTATSPASSSTSLSKKERKKALLQQMIALEKEEDSDEEDSASSAPIYDPQRDFFGNSGFGDDVPGLEDL
jgi:hypothetical protein